MDRGLKKISSLLLIFMMLLAGCQLRPAKSKKWLYIIFSIKRKLIN